MTMIVSIYYTKKTLYYLFLIAEDYMDDSFRGKSNISVGNNEKERKEISLVLAEDDQDNER